MSFDYSKLASLRPKEVAKNKEDSAGTGVPTPVPTPVPPPVEEPASPEPDDATVALNSAVYLDATHTASEQKVYSVMYRHERERHWGFKDLSRLTGISSDKTIRKAIDGLVAKASIEIIDFKNGNRLGPKYRVYSPKEIAQRRRRYRVEIDTQTKRIADGLDSTGVGTGVKKYGGTPVESTGVILLNSFLKYDDDSAPLVAALLSLAPLETEEGARSAANEIIALIVTELEQATSRASEVPSSARFGVECIRRALGRGEHKKRVPPATNREPIDEPSPAAGEPGIYEIRTIAARLFEVHRSDAEFSRGRLRELVRDALIAQGRGVDEDAIDEAIRGMAE